MLPIDQTLPIFEVLDAIKTELRSHTSLLLEAPPGAGKSTVLPLELLREPWLKDQKIIVLEPRKLAARAVASRLAAHLGEEVGETVGFVVRFENKTSPKTRILVCTEGVLSRMIQSQNDLDGVGIVIFDEFHERSLQADVALVLTREVQQVLREDLRILVMSATLESKELQQYMGDVPSIISKGRQHPITVSYHAPDPQAGIAENASILTKKAFRESDGDVLVFLPGAWEIEKCKEILESELPSANVWALYGDLPAHLQQSAISKDPTGQRKIILSTSIAETSLTIEGIKVVVDSGWAKVPAFDPRSGLTQLLTQRVALDAAAQRAGRAGRLGPGKCYRMWTEATQHQLEPHRIPEILAADLCPLTLEMAQWNPAPLEKLSWITPPPSGAAAQARSLLEQLGAMESGLLTPSGKKLAEYPTHPRIAHLLEESFAIRNPALGATLAAILEERDPLPKDPSASLYHRLEEYAKFQKGAYAKGDKKTWERIRKLATHWLKNLRSDTQPIAYTAYDVGRLVASAYPERMAGLVDEKNQKYKLANGKQALLPPNDDYLAHEPWLAIAQMDGSPTAAKIYLAAPFQPSDLIHLQTTVDVVRWDDQKGQIIAQKETRLGDLILKTTPLSDVSPSLKLNLFKNVIQNEGFGLLGWEKEDLQWIERVTCVGKWRPEESWPVLDAAYLAEKAEHWLSPHLANVKKKEDFAKIPPNEIQAHLLSWDLQQQLDTLAPASLKVPSGFSVPLIYDAKEAFPVLAVRLQEVFGLMETPTLNEGRQKVLLHLLSPGFKPVQVTQDLRSFWQNTYPIVRKELKIRYPKHAWPEDPWTAEAVRGVKKLRLE